MKKNILNKKGFTLVETLIYVAIFALVSTALISFILNILNIHAKNYVEQEVEANARMALDIISGRIRAASDINIGTSVFGSDPGLISLAMADVSKNPTIIDLSADNGTLRIKEGTSAYVNLTSSGVKITNLVFTHLSQTALRDNIRVEITVEYNNSSGDKEYQFAQTLQTAINLRK